MTPYADQLAAQQRQWESTCDCCPEDRSEEIRRAIERDPQFIAEAIGNADLTDLIKAHIAGDAQWVADALADIVTGYVDTCVRGELRRQDWHSPDYPRTDADALENIARVWGVRA